jgi:preprotein translocase subunit SecA
MATLNLPEDMPIENKLISRSIESAQKKVEGNNFDIRKHLVDYDDVINKHREAIYRRRREILLSGRNETDKDGLSSEIVRMLENEIEQVVSFHTTAEEIKDWQLEDIYQAVSQFFPVEDKLKTDLLSFTEEGNKFDLVKARTAIIEHLSGLAASSYASLKNQAAGAGLDWSAMERNISLQAMDMMWIEHLEAMSALRQGIGLRGYGQRDPLIEYKKEAYGLYNELNNLIQRQIVSAVFKAAQVQIVAKPFEDLLARASFSAPAKEGDGGPIETKAVDSSQYAGVGRNDSCPCGSGLKYKKCHGK